MRSRRQIFKEPKRDNLNPKQQFVSVGKAECDVKTEL